MDFVTGLLLSKLKDVIYDAILIMMDQFTKMVKYLPINTIINATQLADLFHMKIICCYGMPNRIINDRGFIFINAF